MFARGIPLVVLFAGLVLVPSATANVIYDVQSTVEHLHVSFELPVFQQPVVNQTVFKFETWDFPVPITNFTLSGGSGACSVGGPSGPCWAAAGGGITTTTLVSPLFNGLGTFSATNFGATTTITITTPEPSPAILLSGALLGIIIVTGIRRFASLSL